MKQYIFIGSEIILNSFSDLDDLKFLQIAYEITSYCHEKYNGEGYRDALLLLKTVMVKILIFIL